MRLRDSDGDDVAEEKTIIVDGLPSEGDHQTDKLKFGPDGLLYFGQGSSTDNGVPEIGRFPERPLNATLLRIDPDNPQVSVFARGLRNPSGWLPSLNDSCSDRRLLWGDLSWHVSGDLSPP